MCPTVPFSDAARAAVRTHDSGLTRRTMTRLPKATRPPVRWDGPPGRDDEHNQSRPQPEEE
jgi:hypothetical protein